METGDPQNGMPGQAPKCACKPNMSGYVIHECGAEQAPTQCSNNPRCCKPDGHTAKYHDYCVLRPQQEPISVHPDERASMSANQDRHTQPVERSVVEPQRTWTEAEVEAVNAEGDRIHAALNKTTDSTYRNTEQDTTTACTCDPADICHVVTCPQSNNYTGPDQTTTTTAFIDILFDGPPSHESGRFVEVENERGESISVGEWIDRGDGFWALRIRKETSRG